MTAWIALFQPDRVRSMTPARGAAFLNARAPGWTGFGAALAIAVCLATPATDGACAAGLAFPDSLSMQLLPLDHYEQEGLLESLARQRAGVDTLGDGARGVVESALREVVSICRTRLLSKSEEPGSPWLSWRALARIESDSCTWYVGAVSCVDSLCGPELVLHDRLAVLSVGRFRSKVALFPSESATIADDQLACVDSVAVFRSNSHVLVQARRVITTEHPCWSGPGSYSAEESDFVVLCGDSVVQSFSLTTSSEDGGPDDEAGDSGTTLTSTVRASDAVIQVERRTETWDQAADGPPARRIRETKKEAIRLEYRPTARRYVRVK